MAALRRDGSSLSAFMLSQLRAWWGLHKPGNPQTGMERFVSVTQAEVTREDPGTTATDPFWEQIIRTPTPALKGLAAKLEKMDYGSSHRTSVMMLLHHRELVGPNCTCRDCGMRGVDEERR